MTLPNEPVPRTSWISYCFFLFAEGGCDITFWETSENISLTLRNSNQRLILMLVGLWSNGGRRGGTDAQMMVISLVAKGRKVVEKKSLSPSRRAKHFHKYGNSQFGNACRNVAGNSAAPYRHGHRFSARCASRLPTCLLHTIRL
jgi:hypothetical protein